MSIDNTPPSTAVPGQRDPFELFMGSHEEIRLALDTMRTLSAAGQDGTPPAELRTMAEQLLTCFETVVLPHHREEEREFWPMISHAKATPDERAAFVQTATRLQDEHAELERKWSGLQGPLRSVAMGRTTALPVTSLSELAAQYARHAQFEDEFLVPLARLLLSPTEQTRLAVSILLSRLPAGKWGMV